MIEHASNTCPVHPDCLVLVDLADGTPPFAERAGALAWGPGAGPAGEGRIVRFAVAVETLTH